MELLDENNYVSEFDRKVKASLNASKIDGFFEGKNGDKLYYVRYFYPFNKKTVIILHGFTESLIKFEELSYYFLREGFNVYLYDQRGHGKSHRDVEGLQITHVENFSDYMEDLDCFVRNVVTEKENLFLFAHSMGGAVGALYLETHPDAFSGAVLSSPMICPDTGKLSARLSLKVAEFLVSAGFGKKTVLYSSKEYKEELFENSNSTSLARFERYANIRNATAWLKNTVPSCNWIKESLRLTDILIENADKIKTPFLLFSAEKDTVVRNDKQCEFCEKSDIGVLKVMKDAKHEIFNSENAVLEIYLNSILDFFSRCENRLKLTD